MVTSTGYWTEGKVVNGTNVGGGTFVPGTSPAPISTPTPAVTPASVVTPVPKRTPGLLENAQNELATAMSSRASAQSQADAYAAQMRQARIDAINTTFAPRIAREQQLGEDRLSKIAALNFKSGVVGSGVDATNLSDQRGKNEASLKAIEDAKATAINEAFGWADELSRQRAEDIYKSTTENAQANVDLYKQRADTALNALKVFGNQNVTADKLKSIDPNTYATLRDVSGMTDGQIDAYLKVNAPTGTYQWDQAQVHGQTMVVPKIVNGKVILDKLDLGFTPTAEFKGSAKTDNGVIAFFNDGSYKYIGDPNANNNDSWGSLSNSDKTAAENWIRQQADFSQSDIEKLHTDRTFQALVLKQVQQEKSALVNPFSQ